MKRFLVMALAAFAFAACSEKEESGNAIQNGELEQSYVAITIAADDMGTRADDGGYEDGREEESRVHSAYVFFFKNGAPFHVNLSSNTTTNSGAHNYLEIDLSADDTQYGTTTDNVTDIKEKVLVIQNYKGEYPNQMVAVLNWTPTEDDYELIDLQTAVTALGNDANGYVMSNSVYLVTNNGNNTATIMDYTPLTEDFIFQKEADAMDHPVQIYVERVAAKVEYTATNNGSFNTGVEVDGTPIYAHIQSFELYNDYEQSYLLKHISKDWNENEIGFAWNNPAWFRSYWATSLGVGYEFPENTFNWNNDNTALNGYNYLGENTRAWTVADDVRTKVIVKALLGDEEGHAIEVVNWYGKNYVGEDNLKIVVANTLNRLYWSSTDGANFVGLENSDLKCVARNSNDPKAYEVYFQLSTNGEGKTWYKHENGVYSPIDDDELNTALAAVQPALVYNDGMAYYWLDIEHLGNAGKTAEYGIVRNHVYKVNITGITGLGTPIYDPTQDFIVPEKPKDINTFVSAQINILSWHVVNGDYILGN